MRTTLTALATAATVAVTAIAAPTAAEARWRGGWGWRGPVFVGGLAAGTFVGAAFARPYAYGYGPYGYYGSPYAYGYYGAPYVAYAAPVYTGYYVSAYPCRTYWNGWRWVSYYGC